jgi:argininosuccinate lyase
MVRDMTVDVEAMRRAAGHGFSTATDLADWLVREAGLPFREAHHVTGRAVAMAEARRIGLEALSLEDLRELHPAVDERVFGVLGVDASVKSRTSFGGTAPDNVRREIAAWRGRLPAMREMISRIEPAMTEVR